MLNEKYHHTRSFAGQFLIAMPHLQDSDFSQTLTYICSHTEEGAMGIIVNRATPYDIDSLFDHLDFTDYQRSSAPLYNGGPTQPEKGFILHSGSAREWEKSHACDDDVVLSVTIDVLKAISEGRGPEEYLIALGYAGWGPGQLEDEIKDNRWLSCQANSDILFRTAPEERLHAAASTLGVDLNLMTSQFGHA
ncbi:MAG: YqgE/AlgH family protein [Pontibacterium sp.]